MRVRDINSMVVLAGSIGIYPTIKNKENFTTFYEKIDKMLKQKEAKLIPDTYLIEYLVDLEFDSENEACAFITHENLIGDDVWKNSEGFSLFTKPKKRK